MASFAAAFGRLPVQVQAALDEAGLSKTKPLSWVHVAEDQDALFMFALQVSAASGVVPPESLFHPLAELIDLAVPAAEVESRRRMGQDGVVRNGAFLWARELVEGKRRRLDTSVAAASSAAPVHVAEKWAKAWKTRRGRAIAHIPDDDPDRANARARIEEKERRRWSLKWAALLARIDAPRALRIKAEKPGAPLSEVHALLARGTGTRRGSTLRDRLRTCLNMHDFCKLSGGKNWFAGAWEFLEYVEELAANDECGKTVPRSRLAALASFEKFGGTPEEDRISSDEFVLAAVAQLEMGLLQGLPPPDKAPPFTAAMVVAFELYACSGRPRFQRFVAMVELIKIYATLRTDDCRGMMVGTIRFSEVGLSAKVSRTKVSGAGRKIQWLSVHVAWECTVSGAPWLAEFKALLATEEFGFKRDYLLPRSACDLNSACPRPAGTDEAIAYLRAVLADLRVPNYDHLSNAWYETPVILLPAWLVAFFRGHSARKVLPSWAAPVGFPTEEIDKLGRWRMEGSENYVLSMRATVLRIQRALLCRIKCDLHAMDESEVLQGVEDFAHKQGIDEIDANTARDKIAIRSYMPVEYKSNMQLHDEAEQRLVANKGVNGFLSDVSFEERRWEFMQDAAVQVAEEVQAEVDERKASDADACLYILAHTRRRRQPFITLHRTGGCRWADSGKLRHVEVTNTICTGDFSARCKDCFDVARRVSNAHAASELDASLLAACEEGSVTSGEEESSDTDSSEQTSPSDGDDRIQSSAPKDTAATL